MLHVRVLMAGLTNIVKNVKIKVDQILNNINMNSNFKGNCTITEFKGKHFAKLPKIYIDEAVVSKFEKFEEIAKKCKVNVQQSRSFSVKSFKRNFLIFNHF